jgi:hypothetical protein
MSARQAQTLADEQGLDVVELSETASPPVCKLMNYDKYRYEQRKKIAEAKKKQTVVEVKEVKFRPKTEEHDLNFKIKHIKKFLAQKNKVKITLEQDRRGAGRGRDHYSRAENGRAADGDVRGAEELRGSILMTGAGISQAARTIEEYDNAENENKQGSCQTL